MDRFRRSSAGATMGSSSSPSPQGTPAPGSASSSVSAAPSHSAKTQQHQSSMVASSSVPVLLSGLGKMSSVPSPLPPQPPSSEPATTNTLSSAATANVTYGNDNPNTTAPTITSDSSINFNCSSNIKSNNSASQSSPKNGFFSNRLVGGSNIERSTVPSPFTRISLHTAGGIGNTNSLEEALSSGPLPTSSLTSLSASRTVVSSTRIASSHSISASTVPPPPPPSPVNTPTPFTFISPSSGKRPLSPVRAKSPVASSPADGGENRCQTNDDRLDDSSRSTGVSEHRKGKGNITDGAMPKASTRTHHKSSDSGRHSTKTISPAAERRGLRDDGGQKGMRAPECRARISRSRSGGMNDGGGCSGGSEPHGDERSPAPAVSDSGTACSTAWSRTSSPPPPSSSNKRASRKSHAAKDAPPVLISTPQLDTVIEDHDPFDDLAEAEDASFAHAAMSIHKLKRRQLSIRESIARAHCRLIQGDLGLKLQADADKLVAGAFNLLKEMNLEAQQEQKGEALPEKPQPQHIKQSQERPLDINTSAAPESSLVSSGKQSACKEGSASSATSCGSEDGMDISG